MIRRCIVQCLALGLLLVACDDKKNENKGGETPQSPTVSDADLQVACDNMRTLVSASRADRLHSDCLAKTRGAIPAPKLASYVDCLKGAKSETDLISCQKAAHQ